MRILGRILLTLLGVVVVFVAFVVVASTLRWNKKYNAPSVAIAVPNDSASVARGAHLVQAIAGCTDCHGADFAGGVVVDSPPLGRVYAPNITTGRGGTTLTDAEIARLIRYGVKPNGHGAVIMPSDTYVHMSDADLGAIIAYMRTRPPVDKPNGPIQLGPVGRALTAFGQLQLHVAERIDPASVAPLAPAAGRTVEYGRYLSGMAGCTHCHHADLTGGKILGGDPSWPPAPNITTAGAIAGWSEQDFISMMRTGTDRVGHVVNPVMGTKVYKNMTDDELLAVWMFLQSVPPAAASAH